MHQYILFGMSVFSDLDFPQLIPSTEKTEAAIYISSGDIPKEIFEHSERKWGFGDTISWLENSTCYLYITDGNRITYETKPDADIMKLRSYILGWGMSMAALQRKELAMHCSVVATEKGAILISGESGCGKSTVTTHFLENGYRLVADDMALAEIREDGSAWIKPAFPYQKLCDDVAIQKGYDLNELIHIDEIKGKYLVKYPGEFKTTSEPILGMIILCKAANETVEQKDIIGMERFYACANNLFLRHLLGQEKYSPMIGNQCLKMAAVIPMKMIVRPSEGDTLAEVLSIAWDFAESVKNVEGI